MTNRRTFLRTGSLAAAAATFGHSRVAQASSLLYKNAPIASGPIDEDPDFKALALRALDAAKSAGASYADVRFTRTRRQQFGRAGLSEDVDVAVGVRALVNGAWGFSTHMSITPDMVAWLGRTASELAAANVWPNRPPVELGARPPVVKGDWKMPVKRDPFDVPPSELADLAQNIMAVMQEQRFGCSFQFCFDRKERTFASTDGSLTTQVIYNALGHGPGQASLFGPPTPTPSMLFLSPQRAREGYHVPLFFPQGAGYEALQDLNILSRLSEWMEIAEQKNSAPLFNKPGRYEVVFDGHAMGALIGPLGAALEVDRALGYEAGGMGTSFLAPIGEMLGSKQFPANLTLTADRTMIGGAATVQWDDEGVAAQAFPLIKAGTVVDYATSREFIGEMSGWYNKQGQPPRSRGCAGSQSASHVPLVCRPNVVLDPGSSDATFDSLLSGIEDGLAVLGGRVEMDQQQLNGLGTGNVVYEVKKGKLAGMVSGTGYIFRIPDLWKSLVALGGPKTAMTQGFMAEKGQPAQTEVYSTRAVAGRFTNVAVREIPRGRRG